MHTYEGVLSQSNPDETYKLKLYQSKRYVIELEGTGSDALEDPYLFVLGEGGEYHEDDNSGNDGAALIELRPAKTQYYDLTALAASGAYGAFTLTVKIDDFRDSIDGAARVGEIDTDGTTRQARIDEAGDTDIFEIRLVKGLNYNLRLEPGPSGTNYVGNPKLTLLSHSGEVITTGNDSGTEGAAFIDYIATRNGLHYMQAEASGDDTGTYRILASIGRASYQNDEIEGTRSSDSINALEGDDTIKGGFGDDRIWGANGADDLRGGQDNDMIRGGDGFDRIQGGAGRDTLRGEEGDDWVHGGRERDEIYGGDGMDQLYGGKGRDMLRGESENDRIDGGGDYDRIYGGNGDDTLIGGDGGDSMYGDDGADVMRGEEDGDYMVGGKGDDTMKGGDSGDNLYGGNEDDALFGGKGNDYISGENGDDRLDGGSGSDYYSGGGGNDTFVFSDVEHSTKKLTDRIYRFDNPGEKNGDLFDLSAIDADSTTGGNQSLVFDSEGSGNLGTVWLEDSTKNRDSSIYVYANTDDDAAADLVIRIYNYQGRDAADYTADDFIL